MPGFLELTRSRSELDRQLVRRIGYTEGLAELPRFARLAVLVGDRASTPASALADILSKEFGWKRSYAQGVRDVMYSLGLLRRVGTRLALSARGRALRGLVLARGEADGAVRSLLMASVVDADGDYALNLAIGPEPTFLERIAEAIETKSKWVEESSTNRMVKEHCKATIARALKSLSEGRVPRARRRASAGMGTHTLRHTVTPRRGWIRDIGLANVGARDRAHSYLTRLGQLKGDSVALGLSTELREGLMLDAFPDLSPDAIWELTSLVAQVTDDDLPLRELLVEAYRTTRLQQFNQAEIRSLYDYSAAVWASNGTALTAAEFEAAIANLIETADGKVWRLSARRGRGLTGYVAMKADSLS